MAPKTKKDEGLIAEIKQLIQGTVTVFIVGTTPLWLNRMSEKAKRVLLAPGGPKSKAERALNLKHNPIEEYRDSVYRMRDPKAPAYLGHLATAFKKAMMTAALHTPETRKAEIGRMTYVTGDMVPIFGVPELGQAIVRDAGMSHTPDVRTRAVMREWACMVNIRYTQPALTGQGVANLMANAGIVAGIGDWRQEKGAGNYGLFRVCGADDPDFKRIVEAGGREAQIAALETPAYYDDETADLMLWFDEEIERRQKAGKPSVANYKRGGSVEGESAGA